MSERAAIFVVDDEKRMCESLKALLQPRGYDSHGRNVRRGGPSDHRPEKL